MLHSLESALVTTLLVFAPHFRKCSGHNAPDLGKLHNPESVVESSISGLDNFASLLVGCLILRLGNSRFDPI